MTRGQDGSHWLARWIARRIFTFAPLACVVIRWERWIVHGWGRKLDIPTREFFVTTTQDQKLAAVHIPAVKPAAGKLPVLMTHGWMEVKEIHFRVARMLAMQGHDVVLFDMRSHGRSSGWRFYFGAVECADVAAMLDAMAAQKILTQSVITIGYSTGASLMLLHAPTDARVAGVVAYAPFCDFISALDSFRQLFLRDVGSDWLRRGVQSVAKEWNVKLENACAMPAAERMQVPTLLIAGDRDRRLPMALHAKKLAQAMRSGRGEFMAAHGAFHTNLCHYDWNGVDEKVVRFCERVSAEAAGGKKNDGEFRGATQRGG